MTGGVRISRHLLRLTRAGLTTTRRHSAADGGVVEAQTAGPQSAVPADFQAAAAAA
ncbi:hypothetical protein AB0D40_31310 [Streptomyces massasporeus]|uniref:hypothetical protein n=1 Tax=Streptomyces massasporeus TaxID=67324 RepID=UPI00340A72A8